MQIKKFWKDANFSTILIIAVIVGVIFAIFVDTNNFMTDILSGVGIALFSAFSMSMAFMPKCGGEYKEPIQ